MKFRNFGKKSLTELDELVAIKNLNWNGFSKIQTRHLIRICGIKL
jgi:hypothetical protein